MDFLFSAASSSHAESSGDIYLLTDQELMNLWEQTQLAISVIESRGGTASAARHYEKCVLMELQRRQALRPARELFGSAVQDDPLPDMDVMPHVMMIRA